MSDDVSYNPANLKLVNFPDEAIIELANHAKELGVLIHIDGIPFGDYEQSARLQPEEFENDF
jgi:hypothetical protein